MTLISRRDASKILLVGSTGLVMGTKNMWAAGPGQTVSSQSAGKGVKPAPPPTSRPSGRNAAVDTSKRENENPDSAWSDILLTDGPEPIVSYRTGWVVYEESLTKGQFVGRGWNGAGYINFYDGRLNPAEYPTPQENKQRFHSVLGQS